MGTYLTNPKMSPELRARIEASVRAGRPTAGRAAAPRTRLAVRAAVMLVIVGCAAALGLGWQRGRSELDTARQQLLDDHAKAVAPLGEAALERIAAAREVLIQAAGLYEGDHVAPDAVGDGALDELLQRPALYVRGPIEALRSRERLPVAVAESVQDAFAACLLSPPSSSDEKALYRAVRAVYRSGPDAAPKRAGVYRLHALLATEPLLSPRWPSSVVEAETVAEVERRRAEMDGARLERAAEASQADLLIYVLDEPKKPGTLAEIDGACNHMVRVGIVDLRTSKALMRLRRRVDPSWISEPRRVGYARGLNGCRLAVEVRRSLAPAPPPPSSSPSGPPQAPAASNADPRPG